MRNIGMSRYYDILPNKTVQNEKFLMKAYSSWQLWDSENQAQRGTNICEGLGRCLSQSSDYNIW